MYISHEGTGVGEVTDVNLNQLGTFNIAEPWGHASIGRFTNGHDVLFTVQYDDPIVGTLIACDMTDLTAPLRQVVSESNGYPYPRTVHISAISFQNPGFVVLSITGTTTVTQILDQEIVLVDANSTSGKIARVCHHRSWGKEGPQGYWAEPHAVPSPSGTRILFGSDWGGTNTVDTYVAELPAYTGPAVINNGKSAGTTRGVSRTTVHISKGSYGINGRLIRKAGSSIRINRTKNGFTKISGVEK
jgi:hypothetical protein